MRYDCEIHRSYLFYEASGQLARPVQRGSEKENAMLTFLIVLIIVGTMIFLATRLSLYLYKSGALGNRHIRRLRRLNPVAVGSVSQQVPAGLQSQQVPVDDSGYNDISEHTNFGPLLLVFLFVIGLVLIVI